MSRSGPDKPLPTLLALLGLLSLVLAPHVVRVPLWIVPALLLVAGWRVYLERTKRALPSRWVLSALTVGAAVAVASSGAPLGRELFLALLTLLVGLKLLETRTDRDRCLLVFLCYFLVLSHFLYAQTLPTAAYLSLVALLSTTFLVHLADDRRERGFVHNLGLAARLLAQALPLALAAFVLFPRIARPLWALPDPHAGRSGLSDTLALGDLRRVVLSEEVAFRVVFEGAVPEPEERYWRGPVLEQTDGETWRRSAGVSKLFDPTEAYRAEGAPIAYTVILEPHGQTWLLALDLPTEVPGGAVATENLELRTGRSVRQPLRYEMASHRSYTTGPLSEAERGRTLQLPEVSDRVRRLALSWSTGGTPGAQVVARGLEHFRREPFVYSLDPPPVDGDPVDAFLFETRTGFCEHFAVAFATVLRAAGVPARIVTGYQGGQLNPLGGYWVVRQSDAHAWCEVWLQGSGWTRVDPTAVVAPERVSLSIDVGATTGAVRYLRPGTAVFLRQLRHLWDSVESGWSRWVVGYGEERQRFLLGRVGLGWFGVSHLAGALAVFCALGLGVLAWWVLRAGRERDELEVLYGKWVRKLERAGFPRKAHEGPLDYAARVARARVDLAAAVEGVTGLYVELRYGPFSENREKVGEGTRRMRSLVRAFRARTPRGRPEI